MDELECSRSTLFRTIAALRDRFGAPIENVPGRGYRYDPDAGRFELPGLWFRKDELEALLVMKELVRNVQPGLLHDLIGPFRKRIRALLDWGRRRGGRFPANRFRILQVHAREIDPRVFETAATAVTERRQLGFTYEARSTGDTTVRRTSPQRLVYYRDQWYVDCWDEDGQSLRTFALDRMTATEILDSPCREVSTEELIETFGSGYGLFSGPARHRARLRFTPERTRWVADECWHSRQESTLLPDGCFELTVPYSDPRELLGEILRHGSDVEVLEPAELVDAVREHLVEAAAQYERRRFGSIRGQVSGSETAGR